MFRNSITRIFFLAIMAGLTPGPVRAQEAALSAFQEQALFVNGTGGYACYRIPAVVRAPNGDLLAFAEGRVSACDDFGDVDIVLRRSSDNGQSWGALQVVADKGNLQAGNPAPVVDLLDPRHPKGRIFLVYNTGNDHEAAVRAGKGLREVWYRTSKNNGRTWSKPVNITAQVHRPMAPEANPRYQFAEDWRSYASAPGHAIQLQKAPYRGRLYIPANHSAGEPQAGFNDYRAHAFFSDDHGRSWHIGADVDVLSSNESIAVELADGRVMQNIRQQNGSRRQRLVALSSTGGESWDTAYFDAQLPSPVCQAGILDYQAPDGRRALLFSHPNSTRRREHMTVRLSYDEGLSWPQHREIFSGPSAYSDLVVQADGRIGLLYERGNDGGIHYACFTYAWLMEAGEEKEAGPPPARYLQAGEPELAPPLMLIDSVLFEEGATIRLKLDLDGAAIFYTLDGSEPTQRSDRYTTPVRVSQSGQLRARAFGACCRPGAVVSQAFFRLGSVPPPARASLTPAPDEPYAGQGVATLIDRQKGSPDFRDGNWLGFSGEDAVLELEWDKTAGLSSLMISSLADAGAWIFPPRQVEVWGADGEGPLKHLKTADFPEAAMADVAGFRFLEVELPDQPLRRMRIIIHNQGALPAWHPGAGTPAWLFLDEVFWK